MSGYGVLDDGQDDEDSAADDLAQALADRRQRRATLDAMAQSNPNGSLGAILSNVGVGLGATVAGRDAGSAVRENMNSISARSANATKLAALEDASDMKGLLALAQLRAKEQAPTKDPLGVQTLKNTGAIDLQKLKNQGAVDTTGAKGKSAIDVQGLKNEGAMDVEGLRSETKQQMNEIVQKLGELKDATTRRGQDYGDQHFQAGLEFKYDALKQRLDEIDRNNASRKEISDAGNKSREDIATQGNQTKQKISDSANDTKLSVAEGNNQTSKDVAGINAGAKTGVAGINAAAKKAGNSDISGRNGPVARDRLQLQANQKYESTMHNTELQLYAANRVNALIKGIRAGDLVGTSQLKSDLSGALASMLNNGKPATVYGMNHQDFNSAYGDVEKAYGYLSGSTPGTITDDQLSQLGKDVAALKKEYMLQHQVQYNSFSKGLPDSVVPKLNDRFNYFRNSIQEPRTEAPTPQKVVIPYAPGQGPGQDSALPPTRTMLDGSQFVKVPGGWKRLP